MTVTKEEGPGPVRIALCQIDVTVGDIDGNTARAIEAVKRASGQGATVTLLPELTLTGYPPEDLLARASFIEENIDALKVFASECETSVVVGFVDRTAEGLHNAAALCRSGQVVRVYHKRRLPNYGVFDEARWFRPGIDPGLVQIEDRMAALGICEDIWDDSLPVEAVCGGARMLLNISASPFHADKGSARERMLCDRARDNGVIVAYCNLVGAQDELVFDGRSCVVAPDGRVLARAKAFEEDLLVVDVGEGGAADAGRLEEVPEGPEEVWAALRAGLGGYVRKNGFSRVVLGLSGGIDSALTAALAVDALGEAGVVGVIMPSRYSTDHSVTDARELANRLGIDVLEIPVEEAVSALETALAPAFGTGPPGVAEENLQARVRGTLLMGLSNRFGWLVLATGNKSELSVGYSTLYGDMVGGFAPIRDVFKTRVYELARWRNSLGAVIPEASIDKEPSAELRPGQTDRDTLPDYEVLDRILAAYVEGDASVREMIDAGLDASTVQQVCRMVDASEHKRRQGPLGVRITPKAFGRDRRMPVTNAYRG